MPSLRFRQYIRRSAQLGAPNGQIVNRLKINNVNPFLNLPIYDYSIIAIYESFRNFEISENTFSGLQHNLCLFALPNSYSKIVECVSVIQHMFLHRSRLLLEFDILNLACRCWNLFQMNYLHLLRRITQAMTLCFHLNIVAYLLHLCSKFQKDRSICNEVIHAYISHCYEQRCQRLLNYLHRN